MKAENVVKGIGRVVVMLHPGQLAAGSVFPVAMTDFAHDDAELDDWKKSFTESGGACLYDGPVQSRQTETPSVNPFSVEDALTCDPSLFLACIPTPPFDRERITKNWNALVAEVKRLRAVIKKEGTQP